MGTGGSTAENAIPLRYGFKTLFANDFSVVAGAGLGAGVPVIGESAAASQQTGWIMDAAADEIHAQLDLEELDIDLTRDIHAKVDYVSLSADADSPVFIVFAKGVAVGETEGVATSSPDGQATFPALLSGGQNKLTESGWQALNVAGELTADRLLQLCVEMDSAGGASSGEIIFKCLKLRYTRRITNPNSDVRQLT